MKNILKAVIAGALLLSATSCAFPLPSSGAGWIYTDVTEGVFANGSVRENRSGEVCSKNILGIVSTGDTSIDLAKKQARINNVASIDRTYEGVLGIYAKSCTIVKGN